MTTATLGPLDAWDARERLGIVRRPPREKTLTDALVMMVDDEQANIDVAQAYLENSDFRRFVTTSDATAAIDMIFHEHPDVVLLDLMMPGVSGFEILAEMQMSPQLRHIPVIVLTSSTDGQTKLRALELGATDFLGKPVDPSELVLRIRNTLGAKAYQDHLANYSAMLEHQVRKRTEQLDLAHRQIIHCLARASEFRDDDTGQHVIRVGRYSEAIARELGLNSEFCDMIRVAAQLHDVGKIGIPDSILLKPARLDAQEYRMMTGHCDLGTDILTAKERDELKTMARHAEIGATIMGSIPDSPIMRMATEIAATHHERWDGSGYPQGLSGEEIPVEGRIVAVADVYDALSSKRPYKDAWPPETCFEAMRDERGQHFSPDVIDAFFRIRQDIVLIQQDLADHDGESQSTHPNGAPAHSPAHDTRRVMANI